jgi:plasmid stability protein
MHTVTIPDISDDLHRQLEERARTNHRTVADEARHCLEAALAEEAALLDAISTSEWGVIEDSVAGTLHDRGTPLTEADFQRYRELARGHTRS